MHTETVRRLTVATAVLLVSVAVLGAPDAKWDVAYMGSETGNRPSGNVALAAGELSKYMSMVLGTEIKSVPWSKAAGKSVILVTEAKYAPPEMARRLEGKSGDAFAIRYPFDIEGRKVCLLVSHDDLAYDYPVYFFLTRFLDVHWVGPGELGEVVPDRPDWRMPEEIDVLENPDFEIMRQLLIDDVLERRWLAGSSRMQFNHAIPAIFDPQKYGKTDPDIYPLVEGKRYIPPQGKQHGNWMPCTSNPRTIEIAVQHVLGTLRNEHHLRSVSLSPPDGGGNVCMCASCRAQDSKDAFANPSDYPHLTDRYYRFFNAVIEKALEKNPNAYITVFAYGPYVGRAPSEVKLHPRIIVMNTGPLRRITEGGWDRAGMKALADWAYIVQYQYVVLRNYPHALADEIKLLRSLGGIGFYSSDPSYSAWASGIAVSCYVTANLLWKSDQNVDALVDEYLRLTFGERAAPAMRRYFDKWEEVYMRAPKEEHADFYLYFRHPRQLRNFRGDDMAALDACIADARSAQMTEKQRQRFEMFATFYKWLRLSLEQYLLTGELDSIQSLNTSMPDDIIGRIADKRDLTDQIHKMWEGTISRDRTSWLLGKRHHGDPQRYWTQNEESLRSGIALSCETTAYNIFQAITDKSIAENGKEKTSAFWQGQLEKHPGLGMLIGSQLNRLKSQTAGNRLANPGFEEGEAGNPPRFPGWKTYREWSGILDASAQYIWSAGTGRDGNKALGILEGLYGGVRSVPVPLEPGYYRCSFRARTVNRTYPLDCYLLFADKPGGRALRETKQIVEPTDGRWHKVSLVFNIPEATDVMIQVDSFWQEKGWETYVDDVELVRIW